MLVTSIYSFSHDAFQGSFSPRVVESQRERVKLINRLVQIAIQDREKIENNDKL